jgi:NAD+ synthase/NAD+ synthase (glutamine-hydrolysing)
MKIAIAQLNPTIGDLAGNSQAILNAAPIAVRSGARLLLTPELSLCGYPPRDLLLHPNFVQALDDTLHQLAQQLPPELAVLVGTVVPNPHAAEQGGKPLFNSLAWLEAGQIQQVFHKRLLPTYDVFDEQRYFEPASAVSAMELEGWQLGITICEDLWNDEEFWGKRSYQSNPVADLVNWGVDLIINLSASPFTVGKQRLREDMFRHMARRFGRAIVYVNQVGGNDDLIFDGGSCAVDATGNLVARAQVFRPDLVLVDLQPDGTLAPMQALSPLLSSSDAEIWSALVHGLHDYVRKCGFRQVVLGLSGGIDSALVAAIATAALGPDNVLGVLMPSPYSSEHSISDALALAELLGISTQTIPIAAMMQTFDAALADLFAGTEFGVAEENIQSRIRGTLLMAIANKFGHLLVSTGNKSEMAVGYCTLYGDMNGGLAVIADVPKTRVYSLCRWLNSDWQGQKLTPIASGLWPKQRDPQATIIPPHILTKPPSAELKPRQVDQDSLPPYEVLDAILERWIEQHQSAAEIITAGYDPAIVERVIALVRKAEFKRKQAPPGLKITDRAFGTGWRMPIAQRWRFPLSSIAAAHPEDQTVTDRDNSSKAELTV